jgi:hypothetical protein
MNAEKELLLALLIEKHTERLDKPKVAAIAKTRKRTRKASQRHTWTQSQKEELLMRHEKGHNLRIFAMEHNLRNSQVQNMLYSLLQRTKGGK